MSLAFLLVVTLVLIVVLAQSLKIASESERFAVFGLGRFMDFKGPGLVLVTPYTQKVIRLKVGDIGRVKGPDFVTFGEDDIPVGGLTSFRVGQSVRIDRFEGATPVFSASSIAPKNTCPNCGHSF
jgi:hypothetical protein